MKYVWLALGLILLAGIVWGVDVVMHAMGAQ